MIYERCNQNPTWPHKVSIFNTFFFFASLILETQTGGGRSMLITSLCNIIGLWNHLLGELPLSFLSFLFCGFF
ncbi:hypothetical protein YC2023_080468 [Brassica napus]